MEYDTLYIMLSIVVVIVTFGFVVFPTARYKAPESKVNDVKNQAPKSKVKSV